MRRTVWVALALVGTAVTQAGAAPVPCRLLRDGTRDTGPQELVAPGSTSDVDLVSADVATNAKYLTVALRVRDLATTDPTAGVQGRSYALAFSVGLDAHFSLWATLGSPRTFALYREAEAASRGWSTYRTTPLARATGTVDTAHDEIRMTVPLAALDLGRLTAGSTLTDLAAYSTRTDGDYEGSAVPSELPLGARPVVQPGDPWDYIAPARDVRYVAGARSCVAVGR
jgi:hypothetical protein